MSLGRTPFRIRVLAGEVLEPLSWQFQDEAGVPLDLTGWSGGLGWVTAVGARGSVAGTVSGTVGRVTAPIPAAVTADPGVVEVAFWATNGTTRIASPAGVIEVIDGPPV